MTPTTEEIQRDIEKARMRPRKLKAHREGVWLILMTLGLGVAAINTGHNLLYLILGFLLSLILLSGALSEYVLRRASVQIDAPPGFFAQELTRVVVRFQNPAEKGRLFSVRALPLLGREVAEFVPAYAASVEPGAEVRRILRLRFQRRGLHTLEYARVETDFPFALFTKSRLLLTQNIYRVWPRIYPVDVGVPAGEHREENRRIPRAAPSGDDFFGAREYRPGDPPHRIHWRLSARALKPMIREFQLPRSPSIVISCQIPELGDPAAEDRFAETAASVAVAALNAGYSVGIQTPHASLAPDQGDGQRIRILDLLSDEPTQKGKSAGLVEVSAVNAAGAPIGERVEITPLSSTDKADS